MYRITVKGEKWIVFVGLLSDYPYEVFAGRVKMVDLPSSIEEGELTKIKKGVYQFSHNNEILIKDVTSIFESEEQEALTRQISTNLRHGTPIEFVIDQLSKSNGTIIDFNKSIIRALKRYMKEKKSDTKCSICGENMIFQSGCKVCLSCGNSLCG